MLISKAEIESIFNAFRVIQEDLVNSIESSDRNASYSAQWDDYESRENAIKELKKMLFEYIDKKERDCEIKSVN